MDGIRSLNKNKMLGLIGGGNMAKAIMFPLFEKGLVSPENVMINAKTQGTLDIWKEKGCEVTLHTDEILRHCSIVIWALKPQVFPNVLAHLVDKINSGESLMFRGREPNINSVLNITIMAGIKVASLVTSLTDLFGSGNFRVVRVMPNVGLGVCTGVAVYSFENDHYTDQNSNDQILINGIFEPLGLCYEVPEDQIDAYCALSGSGIGFMFPIMEALSDGAVKMGIPRNRSLEIAAQVMKGAGELYLRSNKHPGALKDMVASPKGTTIAGLAELERGGVRAAIINAVEAATKRGQELGVITPK